MYICNGERWQTLVYKICICALSVLCVPEIGTIIRQTGPNEGRACFSLIGSAVSLRSSVLVTNGGSGGMVTTSTTELPCPRGSLRPSFGAKLLGGESNVTNVGWTLCLYLDMQMCIVCGTSSRGEDIYKNDTTQWGSSMLFSHWICRVLEELGARYKWWQRWDGDNFYTGVALPKVISQAKFGETSRRRE